MMVSFSGCGFSNEEMQKTEDSTALVDIQMAIENTDIEPMNVSNVSAAVEYAGEDFEKSLFCAGSNEIYVCGLNSEKAYFLGEMKTEATQLKYLPLGIPNDNRIVNATVDKAGNCHMLLMSVEKLKMNDIILDQLTFNKSCIMEVSSNGEVINTIDVTEAFQKEEISPYCFVTDSSGNYYYENKNEVIELDINGEEIARIQCDGSVTTLGFGKSGTLYCTYINEENKEALGMIQEGVFVSCGVALPKVESTSELLYAGTDTELLVFNYEGGVYAFDAESNSMDNRISGSELPVKGQNVEGCGFLGDGRLCLLGEGENSKIFYYLPVGR